LPWRSDIPELVQAWSEGDAHAFDCLIELLHDDLRDLAHAHLLRERDSHTLNTTALVNEAYVRLAGHTGPDWQGRAQFFAFLSGVMRHVLVDYARRQRAAKRGGGAVHVELVDADAGLEPALEEFLAVDQALTRLAERDPHLATVVECRFFGGLTAAETADAMGISERTVERHWRRARAHLYRILSPEIPAQ
jgi:RNA polymerase sigma factor (TIGR02999 family)